MQVKEHMMSYMGETSMMPTSTVIKMAKLQMLNVYASSVVFGYFLRRVDQRFQLAKSTGLMPENREEAVERLERLFSLVRAFIVRIGDARLLSKLEPFTQETEQLESAKGAGCGGRWARISSTG